MPLLSSDTPPLAAGLFIILSVVAHIYLQKSETESKPTDNCEIE